MRRVSLLSIALLILAAPLGAQDDSGNPHRMVKPGGEADTDACRVCHNDDMSLSRTKAETCTLCHAANLHAGVAPHLAAEAAAVARLTKAKEPALPLAEDGKIYCGTCHVFHDPAISREETLARRWLPANTGLPQAVRAALTARWEQEARTRGESEPGATFTTRGTTRLRLPIDDGSLCRHCHGYAK